jgi:hypothetical protein
MEGKVVDPPGAAEVGYGPVGELARQELADAARDSRIDRPAAPPMPDFKDAFAEIGSPSGSYLGPSWNGTSRSTEQGHPRRAPDALGAVLVSASRERGRLRVVECCRAVGAPHVARCSCRAELAGCRQPRISHQGRGFGEPSGRRTTRARRPAPRREPRLLISSSRGR